MLRGIERLRRAGDRLRREGESEPEEPALVAAASEVWSAMFDLDSWPDELRERAVALQRDLFRYGPVRLTVRESTGPERSHLRRELLAFCATAERLDRQAA